MLRPSQIDLLIALLLAILGSLGATGCASSRSFELSTGRGVTAVNCIGDCSWTALALRCEDGCSCLYTVDQDGASSTEDGFGRDSNIMRRKGEFREITCLGEECRFLVRGPGAAEEAVILRKGQQLRIQNDQTTEFRPDKLREDSAPGGH